MFKFFKSLNPVRLFEMPSALVAQDKDAKAALAACLAILFFGLCAALADDCPEVETKSGGHCCASKCLAEQATP